MATRISADLLINPGDLSWNFADDNQTTLGARAADQAGNKYRWCKAGAVALVPGKLQQAPAENTAHQNLAVATAAIGATSVTVTVGASAVAANQYAGGWLTISAGTGLGYRYLISSHPANAGSLPLVLTLSDALVAATATSDSKGDLQANPFSGVIVNPATASSAPVGAAVTAITAGFYGWVQTEGAAVLLADGAVAVGTGVVASNAVAGAVEALTGVQAPVGTALTGITTAEYGMVDLKLP